MGHKLYSDAILAQLTDCLDHPCENYGRCLVAVVGDDPYWEDGDRIAEFAQSSVPEAGASFVRLRGKVITDSNAAVSGATVCLRGMREGPCTHATDSGDFSLDVAAHAELAISARAPGYCNRLVGVTTTGKSLTNWNIRLLGESALQSRYAVIGAAYPDDASGYVFATAQAPEGSPTGLEGLTISIQPKPGQGPLYFAPGSKPDPQRTSTSTFSSGLFAGVQPGEATVTFGPPSVTCVPSYGGWPATTPNSMRVPVAAGFETRVTMRCHW